MADKENPQIGEWYAVEMPVMSTKTLHGKLLRIVPTEEGSVYMLQGRFPFAVESQEVISMKVADAPATGIARHLKDE